MARFFINRPIVAIVIAILTVLAGIVAILRLPIAQFPDIVPPQILVNTTYTGADAQTIEQSVATPIEQQMSGVDNSIYMQSANANDGSMNLRVTFDIGTDPNTDQVNAQNRVSQALSQLPSDVQAFGVTVKKSTPNPLLIISLYSPNGTYSPEFLTNYATINVNDAVYRVQGVGQVTNFGGADYAMRVWVRPDRMASLGLTINDLVDAVKQQNNVNPAGQIGGEPAPPGREFTYSVRAQGRLVSADEFGQIVVRLNPDGSTVRLKDVARIELGSLNYSQLGRLNGKPAGIIGIFQAPGSDALKVAAGVRATMERLKEGFPNDLDYVVSLDTTIPVSQGITEIIHTLLEAVVLVIIVVFLFLQGWRPTLIPLIAVPVSLIGAFLVFPSLGFSINTLSLFGLVLAIGLVVDDAIVVVEAVEHHIAHGLSPRDATIKAMDEVSGPVVGIALILSSVFIPIAFLPGMQGRLSQQFAVTIAVSVLISAFNALSLSPALSAMLLKPRKESKGPLGKFFAWFNRWFEKATNGYVKISGALIRKMVLSIGLLVAFAAVSGLLGMKLPASLVPQEDQGYFFLQVQLPDASSRQRTDAVTREIENILGKTPEVEFYNTVVGYSLITQTSATYTGTFFISLKDWKERKEKAQFADALIAKLNREFRSSIPEAIVIAFPPPAIPGLGTAGGFSLWLQDQSGGSVDFLDQNVKAFLAALSKRPEIASANTFFRAVVPQVFAEVDREKAIKQGVPVSQVYQALQAYLGSSYVNQFNRFGRTWKVFFQADASQRQTASDIGRIYVRNSSGGMVPLSALVRTRALVGPEYTTRFNLFRAALITGAPAPGYSSGQAIKAVQEVAAQTLPREMGYSWADLSYQETKAGSPGPVFALSIVFVFLVLAALYESWSLPFSVLLTVPVAVFGAFLGLLMRHFDFDTYGLIGLIVLIGLAAKNAILIIEFAVLEHKKGKSIDDAALEGARLRLRPILMTSFAFVLGCVPLYIAAGSGALSRQILGTAVVWGMLAATGLAIFIIPALYVLVSRIAGTKPSVAQPEAAAAAAAAASHGGAH